MPRQPKKPRATEVLEILALLSGVALLAYYSCRSPEGAQAGARGSKTFSVARPEAVEDASDATARQRAVEEAVRELIGSVALGQLEESQRGKAQTALVQLLERWRWGTDENRATAAAVTVQQVFDQAKLGSRSEALSAAQIRAIGGVAQELTRQLLLLAVGASPGADGLSGSLPRGYERVTWNQLGGFPYREGAPLPPDVQALDGLHVGIFGFMLTLDAGEPLRELVLVESLWGCCFGSVPDVNQTILVRLEPGGQAEFSPAPMLVTGRLEVGEEREGGFVTSLYRIEGAKLEPVKATTPPD